MIIPVDAHHHISNNPVKNSIYNTYDIKGIKEVQLLSNIHINIGLHPLYINEDLNFEMIKEKLIENKNMNIGEVGLDKRGDRETQLEVFGTFIGLAKTLDRTLSVHCVKSWGALLDSIKGLKVPILFHGFNGSREILLELLKYNSYFSFSIRELKIPRIREVCKNIPIERQLVESDIMEDEYIKIGHNNYIELLQRSLEQLSLINSMPHNDFNYIIEENFRNFVNWRE